MRHSVQELQEGLQLRRQESKGEAVPWHVFTVETFFLAPRSMCMADHDGVRSAF